MLGMYLTHQNTKTDNNKQLPTTQKNKQLPTTQKNKQQTTTNKRSKHNRRTYLLNSLKHHFFLFPLTTLLLNNNCVSLSGFSEQQHKSYNQVSRQTKNLLRNSIKIQQKKTIFDDFYYSSVIKIETFIY